MKINQSNWQESSRRFKYHYRFSPLDTITRARKIFFIDAFLSGLDRSQLAFYICIFIFMFM